MGTSNGYVSGLVKIHDGGPPSDRFNLILVAEGYQVGELAQFEADCNEIVAHLFAIAPFDEEAVACALNIYRLAVVSDESGADDPSCADGNGNDTTADTYFDATFCFDGEITRLMAGDSALAQSTVETYLPEWTQIVVVVNDSKRGGAGGSVAWTTTGGVDWKDVLLHELGHAAFGLADEYDYYAGGDETGQDNHPGPEPMQPNVTIEPDPTKVKWASLVTSGSTVPTMDNPDCSSPNNNPNPVGNDIVGTFEGAHYYHCDAFRPQYSCKMRSTGADFCAVCQDEIRETMAAYAVPATTGAITLDTLSLTFDDIPEDTSTVRPVVFSVDTCQPVTFEVTSAPSAPFSVAYEPVVVSNTDTGTVRLARVWIRYDCGAAGGAPDNDSVAIRLVETGETWTVPLSGNCVPRETAAVQLVFDQSGSMLDPTSEGLLKKDVLKDSARVLADVAYEDTGLGANTYDEDAHPLMEIEVAGPVPDGSGREALRDAIDLYEPTLLGLTATGDGIEFAKAKLDAETGYDNYAMIVLTDGKDTASKTVGEVADGVIGQTVYAIGLGTAEQINPQTLETLAGATGGYMLMTGLLTADDTFLLEKFYLQILAGISNNDIILDPEGRLSPHSPAARIPFDVAETDIEISAITLATVPDVFEAALEAPNGAVFTKSEALADPSMDYARTPDSVLFRASLPLVADGQPQREGRWHLLLKLKPRVLAKILRSLRAQVSGKDEASAVVHAKLQFIEDLRQHGAKYSAVVQTYSNLHMAAQLTQTSHEPGADLLVSAILTEYGGPFRGSASVSADVTRPSGSVAKLSLIHEGDGVYSGELMASEAGLYTWRIRANGTTHRGRPFTREQIRTASFWAGGDNPGEPPRGAGDGEGTGEGGLIDLLCCLYRNEGLSGLFLERLKEHGIEPEVFKRCLEELCTKHDAGKPTKAKRILTGEQVKLVRTRVDRLMGEFLKGL